jgi:hypothetical protein
VLQLQHVVMRSNAMPVSLYPSKPAMKAGLSPDCPANTSALHLCICKLAHGRTPAATPNHHQVY